MTRGADLLAKLFPPVPEPADLENLPARTAAAPPTLEPAPRDFNCTNNRDVEQALAQLAGHINDLRSVLIKAGLARSPS